MTIEAFHRAARAARGALGAAGLAVLAVVPLRAQTVQNLDRGSYDIRFGDQSVGRETFVVRREGQVIKAVGRVSLNSARPPFVSEEVWLQTDSEFRPELFRLHPRSGDVENIVARRDGPRIRIQTTSKAGSRSQQLLAPDGLSILEPEIAHEYYIFFRQHAAAAAGGGSWSAPVVVPSLGKESTLHVRSAGADSVRIGGQARAATRFDLDLGGEKIQVWRDDQGRILEVRRPDRGWTAIRSNSGG